MPHAKRNPKAWSLVLLAVLLAGCGGGEGDEPVTLEDAFELPPPALTDKARRDSARVAKLVIAYFGLTARGDAYQALQLFFPDSIPVATPEGGTIIEGRNVDAVREIDDDLGGEPVERIELLRKMNTELLERTYRETWYLSYVPEGLDSTRRERIFHVIQPLGDDVRLLGRMSPES